MWCCLILTIYSQTTITNITATNMIGDPYNGGLYGGHGVMFADADGDNDPDMYITMNNFSPMADLFFENNGSGVFTEKAVQRGIDNFDPLGSHGWVWADLDNDGDFDGWNGSYNKNIPYKNKNNQPGYFDDHFLASGIQNVDHGTRGITAFDFDRDGDLDLFANNWYAGGYMEENEFYRNNGNFTFTRINNGLTFAAGDQGVCDADFDNDGDIDLILSVFDDPNRCVEIWENNNGQFSKVLNTGLNLCGTVDGVTFWDMNNDGWLDVVSGYKIFLNNGNKTFTEVSNVPSGTRFMRGIADLNNDGYWDLISPGLSQVFINNGNLTFTPVNFSAGTIDDPRTVSFADIDGDGDVDFALGQKLFYNQLYRNDYSGNNKHLFINLKTANGQIGAFGTKVFIFSETGDTLLSYRQARGNQGYLSQDDPVLHFGCGARNKVKVKVVFLDNSTFEFITNTNQKLNIPSKLNVNVLIEGLYNDTTMVSDTVSVELRNSTSPYGLIQQKKTILNTLGSGAATFNYSTEGTSYYIVIKHRNSIETWSASSQSFTNGNMNYDFTNDSSNAYGNNMKKKGNKWCILTGDVNQDGLVDLSDEITVINDVLFFTSGTNLSTDVNGDGFVDLSDIIIIVNNTLGFVSKRSPETVSIP
jgi:hypothetical protein